MEVEIKTVYNQDFYFNSIEDDKVDLDQSRSSYESEGEDVYNDHTLPTSTKTGRATLKFGDSKIKISGGVFVDIILRQMERYIDNSPSINKIVLNLLSLVMINAYNYNDFLTEHNIYK